MVAFYANENFPRPVVLALRELGHDVLTIQESGQANQAYPDEQVLEIATQADRAVLTLNRKDFIQLHRRNPDHAGIVICTTDADFIGQAQRISQTVTPYDSIRSQLIRVNRIQK